MHNVAVLVVCLATSSVATVGLPLARRLGGGSEEGPRRRDAKNCLEYCKTVGALSQPSDVNCRGCPGAGKRPKGNPCEQSCGWTIPSSWNSMPGCAGCVAHDDSDDDSSDYSSRPLLGYSRHTRDGDGEYRGCSLHKTFSQCDHDGACTWNNNRCENGEHHHSSGSVEPTRSQGHYGQHYPLTNPSYSSFPGMPSSLPGVPSSLPGVPSSLPGAFGFPSSLPGVPSSLPGVPSSLPGMPLRPLPGVPSSLPGVPSSLPGVPLRPLPGVPSSLSSSYQGWLDFDQGCTRHSDYRDCDRDGACAWTWFTGRSGGSCAEEHRSRASTTNDAWNFGGCASFCTNGYAGRAGWSHNPMCSGCQY